jgi:hypothetical protein
MKEGTKVHQIVRNADSSYSVLISETIDRWYMIKTDSRGKQISKLRVESTKVPTHD